MYNRTVSKDGKYKAGDIMRMQIRKSALSEEMVSRGFYDAIICGFDENDNARLARPYAFVGGYGTTQPRALIGVEYIDMVLMKTLESYWLWVGDTVVLDTKGQLIGDIVNDGK